MISQLSTLVCCVPDPHGPANMEERNFRSLCGVKSIGEGERNLGIFHWREIGSAFQLSVGLLAQPKTVVSDAVQKGDTVADTLISPNRPSGRMMEGDLTKWPASSKATAPAKTGARV